MSRPKSRRPAGPDHQAHPPVPDRARPGGSRIVLLGAATLFGLLVVAVFWLSTSLGDGPVREIGYGEFASLVESGVTVVDIREPWEWEQTGVIEGSHLITAFDAQGRLEPDFLPRFTTLVQPDDEVVLICRTGNRTSFLASALSEQMEYTRIRNVTHGILPWIQMGGPVVACRVNDGIPVC